MTLQQLDGLIADVIETQGSEALGVAVRVTGVTTDLQNGTASISGLSIENAQGFNAEKAFEVAHIEARVDYKSQAIKSVSIQQATINAELIGSKNNFSALLDGMPAPQKSSDVAEPTNDDLIITIERIAITESTINLQVSKLGLGHEELGGERLESFAMDDLVMIDLRGTPEELSDAILAQLAQHVSAQISRTVKSQIKNKAKDKLKQKLSEKLGVELKELGL